MRVCVCVCVCASVKFQTMRASTSASQKLMRVQQEMMAISMCAPRETLNPTYGSLLWESGGAWNIRSYSQRFDSAQITCLLHGDEARQSKGVCLFLCAEALIGNKEICIWRTECYTRAGLVEQIFYLSRGLNVSWSSQRAQERWVGFVRLCMCVL